VHLVVDSSGLTAVSVRDRCVSEEGGAGLPLSYDRGARSTRLSKGVTNGRCSR
jgi:hypothetical protein